MSNFSGNREDRLGLLGASFLFALALPAALYRGWAASIAWGWLIEPTFNAPAIGPIEMACALLVIGFAVHRPKANSGPDTVGDAATSVFMMVLYPPIFLFFAWLLSFFVGGVS